MPKPYIIILILIIVLSLVFIYQLLSKKPQTNLSTVPLTIKGQEYSLEIAKSPSQLAKGLSNRTNLCPRCGMIFVFGTEGIYPFWMKDTLIPLDMIWLDRNGKVVTIARAEPQPNVSTINLKHYTNTSPALYVIELNAGDAQKLGLKEGDVINLPNL